MNFQEYMNYRADEDCDVGAIAFDIKEDECVPFDSSDRLIFFYVESILKDELLLQNWTKLKSDYIQQLT